MDILDVITGAGALAVVILAFLFPIREPSMDEQSAGNRKAGGN